MTCRRASGSVATMILGTACGLLPSYKAPTLSDLMPTCSASDTACIQANLSIYDSSWDPIPLTTIAAGTIQPSQIMPGKGDPTVADSQGSAPTLDVAEWDYCQLATLTFTDPNGARIGGCFNVHPRNVVPGSFNTLGFVAFASVPDGQTSGTFSIRIRPNFAPDEGTASYALDLYPISPIEAGGEAVSELLSGGGIAVGSPVSYSAEVETGETSSSGGSGSSGSSGGSSGCPSGNLLVSTLSCTPDGSAGVSSYCLSASEYGSATGLALPAACAPQSTTGCLNTTGTLVHPCCPGLTCRVSSTCGDSSNAVGGTCLP